MPMTDQALRDSALVRMMSDFKAHPLAHRETDRLTASRRKGDILTEMAAKYLVEALEAQEELKNLRRLMDTLKEANGNLDLTNHTLRMDIARLREDNAQLKADQHSIMSKLTRLQPGGSPPPSGSPVVNAYWIIDSVLNHGHYPVIKHEPPTS